MDFALAGIAISLSKMYTFEPEISMYGQKNRNVFSKLLRVFIQVVGELKGSEWQDLGQYSLLRFVNTEVKPKLISSDSTSQFSEL